MLVALGVTGASLLQTPTYEASALVSVVQKEGIEARQMELLAGKIQAIPNAPAGEVLAPTLTDATEPRPVAEEVIRRLGLEMAPSELLDNLTVEQVEGTSFLRLTYEGTDVAVATDIVNTMAEVSSERLTNTAGGDLTASVYEKARVPDYPTPVSPKPLRNGLLTLVIGLMLCGATVVALPGGGARLAGALSEWAGRQGVGEAGVLGRRHSDYSIVERVKEKKLLRALGRRGKLTAVEAALESELSVEEANRILSALAARGHLEVTVEHGRLLYSLW